MYNANPLRAASPKSVAKSVPGVTPGFTPDINFTLEVKDGWMVPSASKKKKNQISHFTAQSGLLNFLPFAENSH